LESSNAPVSGWPLCTALYTGLFLMPLAAGCSEQSLSLKPGIYATGASACRGAANAQILTWDGVGFSGAHSSQCVSRVLHRRGSHIQLSTTCAALGDGSPNVGGAAYVETFWLNQLSSSQFELAREKQAPAIYRWCSVKLN